MKKLSHKIRHKREQIFADFLTDQGKEFVYQSTVFNINGIQYRPDFYVIKEQTYYEVVGSRQAFHQNQIKINYILSVYPFIKLKIVNPDGSDHIIPISNKQLEIPNYRLIRHPFHFDYRDPCPPSNLDLIKDFISYQKKYRFNIISLTRHSIEIDPFKKGISEPTFYGIMKGKLPKGGSKVEAVLQILVNEFKQKYSLNDSKKEKEEISINA